MAGLKRVRDESIYWNSLTIRKVRRVQLFVASGQPRWTTGRVTSERMNFKSRVYHGGELLVKLHAKWPGHSQTQWLITRTQLLTEAKSFDRGVILTIIMKRKLVQVNVGRPDGWSELLLQRTRFDECWRWRALGCKPPSSPPPIEELSWGFLPFRCIVSPGVKFILIYHLHRVIPALHVIWRQVCTYRLILFWTWRQGGILDGIILLAAIVKILQ